MARRARTARGLGRSTARLVGAALIAVGAAACRAGPGPAPERVTIGGVSWFVDYEAALAVAREQDKALWVHFGENPG